MSHPEQLGMTHVKNYLQTVLISNQGSASSLD
jgi:hypothetical protein